MPSPSQLHLLATAPLHHQLFRLRILAQAACLQDLLDRIDDAIDAVVRTSELERRWVEHPIPLGLALAQSDRQGPVNDGLPTSLTLLEDARQHHRNTVVEVKIAIEAHEGAPYFRRVLDQGLDGSLPTAVPRPQAATAKRETTVVEEKPVGTGVSRRVR